MLGAAGGILSAMTIIEETGSAEILRRNSKGGQSKVSLIKTSDRATGIQRAIDILGINPVKGQDIRAGRVNP